GSPPSQETRRFRHDGARHRRRSNARSSATSALLRGRRWRGYCFGGPCRLGLPLVEQYVHPHLSLVGKRLSSASLNGILGCYFRRDTRPVSKTACGFSGSGLPVGPLHAERLEHRFKHSKGYLSTILTETVPKAKLSPTEYLKQGNLYFSTEV